MAKKKYKVISQGAVLSGKTHQEVYQSLLNMKLKPQQAKALLEGPLEIKRDLDNPKALHYVDVFSKAGLKVRIEGYTLEEESGESQQDQAFALLRDCFSQPIQPTKLSREYQKSIVLALISAFIAPLIYASLVSAVVFALGWYVFSGHSHFFGGFSDRYHNMRLDVWVILLLIPSVIGGILTLFLLYPLWPKGKPPAPYILERKKNLKLYLLVEQMTQAMGVPNPEYIELMPEMNAAAASVKGMRGLLQGRLKLIIGLSLVSGSSVQEMVGVLAHEFGHFSQRKSMLAYIWTNRVTRWLSECAHGQDFWHQKLQQWIDTYDEYPAAVYTLMAAEYAIQGVRKLFGYLLTVHVKMTHGMSQQMEFDADLYEAKVVGSRMFREASINLRKLAYAESHVRKLNFEALENQDKLLKNIPAAVEDIAQRYSDQILNQIDQDLYEEQTEYWHTHPADIERIKHAESAKEAGILTCDLPAKCLFNNFETLCERSTMGLYHLYGIHGAKEFVTGNEQILPN